MPATNLNIVVVNRRMLSAREAAEYCGVPARRFAAVCDVEPVEIAGGLVRYDRHALDRWLDALSAEDADADDEILARLS